MIMQSYADRVFMKDALPRLYEHAHKVLSDQWPELLEQLQSLYLVSRCKCGLDGCVSFMCESSDARFAPINRRRPLSYPLNGIHGWYSISDDGVLAGFEILNDYDDGYLDSQLIEAGFGSNITSSNAVINETSECGASEEGLSRNFECDSKAQEEQATARSVYMTSAATQHLIEYRLGVQAFTPEEVTDFVENAMASSATPEATVAGNVRYPSLLSAAFQDRIGRKFKLRMSLDKIYGGYEVRTVVPEAIHKLSEVL